MQYDITDALTTLLCKQSPMCWHQFTKGHNPLPKLFSLSPLLQAVRTLFELAACILLCYMSTMANLLFQSFPVRGDLRLECDAPVCLITTVWLIHSDWERSEVFQAPMAKSIHSGQSQALFTDISTVLCQSLTDWTV